MHVTLDDLKPTDWITIARGRIDRCPCGCESPIGHESYSNLKGIPLNVLAIEPPYVVTKIGEQRVVIDVRNCELMRVGPDYMKAFGIVAEQKEAGNG